MFVTYDFYGQVIDVESPSDNIVVVDFDDTNIKLKMIDEKLNVSEYGIDIRAIDSVYEDLGVKDAEYTVKIKAESGESITVTEITDNDGYIHIDELCGTGKIEVKIEPVNPAPEYFINSNSTVVYINREVESGVATIDTQSTYDTSICKFDNENNKLIINVENVAKPKENRLVFNVKDIILTAEPNIVTNIAGMKFKVIQPLGLSTIDAVTDTAGDAIIPGLTELDEGDYVYEVESDKNSVFKFKDMRFRVHFNEYKEITSVEEITEQSESIEFKLTEGVSQVYNDAVINLRHYTDAGTVKVILQEVDQYDNSKVLPGIGYTITNVMGDESAVLEGKTDIFGEIVDVIAIQDDIELKIQETEIIKGYVLDDTEKTLILHYNWTTRLFEVDDINSTAGLNVIIKIFFRFILFAN